MKRREFLKTSLAVSALAGVSVVPSTAAETNGGAREYYELRKYRLKPEANHDLLDAFLEKAAIPALNRLGVKPVGVFTEQEPKDGPAVWMLIPYPSLEAYTTVTAKLPLDEEYLKAGAEYLAVPKNNPAFDRIDSWFLLAFTGQPKLEQPAYSRDRTQRIFELRTYESHSESKALKKVEMFNAGEIGVMHEVGLGPIFYGQALLGGNLPHLTYMLSGESMVAHKAHWSEFVKHPGWKKLSGDKQYADTVSKITNRFLTPTAYSQI